MMPFVMCGCIVGTFDIAKLKEKRLLRIAFFYSDTRLFVFSLDLSNGTTIEHFLFEPNDTRKALGFLNHTFFAYPCTEKCDFVLCKLEIIIKRGILDYKGAIFGSHSLST